jgi:hypothetical protein
MDGENAEEREMGKTWRRLLLIIFLSGGALSGSSNAEQSNFSPALKTAAIAAPKQITPNVSSIQRVADRYHPGGMTGYGGMCEMAVGSPTATELISVAILKAAQRVTAFSPTNVAEQQVALSRKLACAGAIAFSRSGEHAPASSAAPKLIRKFGDGPDDLSALCKIH